MEFEKSPLVFTNFPLPPSDNNIKIPIKRFKKNSEGGAQVLSFCKTRAYQTFERDVQIWSMHLRDGLYNARNDVSGWISQKYFLGMHVEFSFPQNKFFSKDFNPLRWDQTNRLKALHDALSRLLLFDDSFL